MSKRKFDIEIMCDMEKSYSKSIEQWSELDFSVKQHLFEYTNNYEIIQYQIFERIRKLKLAEYEKISKTGFKDCMDVWGVIFSFLFEKCFRVKYLDEGILGTNHAISELFESYFTDIMIDYNRKRKPGHQIHSICLRNVRTFHLFDVEYLCEYVKYYKRNISLPNLKTIQFDPKLFPIVISNKRFYTSLMRQIGNIFMNGDKIKVILPDLFKRGIEWRDDGRAYRDNIGIARNLLMDIRYFQNSVMRKPKIKVTFELSAMCYDDNSSSDED
jgi:hypothetical protein